MGYFTAYSLEVYEIKGSWPVRADPMTEQQAIAELRNKDKNLAYAVDEDGCCFNTTKWYDMEDDMLELSKLRPDLVFCVLSDGEEAPDFAKTWFNDGRMSQCVAKLTYPVPDMVTLLGKPMT